MAGRVKDLVVWRLGNELKKKTYAITSSGPSAADWKFRNQLCDAASSVTRNIAEGFGRYRHREFSYFLRIARASLFEVSDSLRDGAERGYWSMESAEQLNRLAKRATTATTRLIRYLDERPDP